VNFQIVPNIILLIAILALVLIIARRIPEATKAEEEEQHSSGVPAQAPSGWRVAFVFALKRLWHFILEAKDLKPQAHTAYRIKKIFKKKQQPIGPAKGLYKTVPPEEPKPKLPGTEAELLEFIKHNPKDLQGFVRLAKYYLDKDQFTEAVGVYEYLTKLEPGNPGFHAKLGFAYYQIENYERAVESFQKSLALDSAQPNRYYNLGLAQEAIGEMTAARKAFKQAQSLDPQNSKYRIALNTLNRNIRETRKGE